MKLRLILMCVLPLALAACGTQNYRAALDSIQSQQRELAAADTAREQQRTTALQGCQSLATEGQISACMLGVTAVTLAGAAGGRGNPLISPPPMPKTGAELLVDLAKGTVPAIVQGVVQLGVSEDSRDVSINASDNLFGALRTISGDSAQVATAAVSSTGYVGIAAVDASARTSVAWAENASALRPNQTINGTGNVLGDGNALDQGSGTRIVGNENQTDQSHTDGTRLQQSGEGNRQASDGPYQQQFECTVVANAAAGGSGGNGAPGGNGGSGTNAGTGGNGAPGGDAGAGGASMGILRCVPSNG